MSERTRIRAGAKSRAVWFKHIENLRKSGLSQAEYCRRHHLNPSSFYNWIGKYRGQHGERTTPRHREDAKTDFIPVTFANSTSEITLTCGNISLTLSSRLTPDALVPWIKALRAGVC